MTSQYDPFWMGMKTAVDSAVVKSADCGTGEILDISAIKKCSQNGRQSWCTKGIIPAQKQKDSMAHGKSFQAVFSYLSKKYQVEYSVNAMGTILTLKAHKVGQPSPVSENPRPVKPIAEGLRHDNRPIPDSEPIPSVCEIIDDMLNQGVPLFLPCHQHPGRAFFDSKGFFLSEPAKEQYQSMADSPHIYIAYQKSRNNIYVGKSNQTGGRWKRSHYYHLGTLAHELLHTKKDDDQDHSHWIPAWFDLPDHECTEGRCITLKEDVLISFRCFQDTFLEKIEYGLIAEARKRGIACLNRKIHPRQSERFLEDDRPEPSHRDRRKLVDALAREIDTTMPSRHLICAPTGSGKSHYAKKFLVDGLSRGESGVFAVPYKALGAEVAESLSKLVHEKCPGLDCVVGVQTGDYEPIPLGNIHKPLLLICTYEKLDAMSRCEDLLQISRFARIVIDEAHMMVDTDRGRRLESLLARLTALQKSVPRITLYLSATVGNAGELASFLDAGLHEYGNEYRRSTLKLRLEMDADSVDLAARYAREGKYVLVFKPTRKKALETARNVALRMPEDPDLLERYKKIDLPATEKPASLDSLILHRTAYHHAGLTPRVRRFIENEYRDGSIQVVSATSTLSAGVNLPADVCIIDPPLKHKDNDMVFLSASDMLQALGRAARTEGTVGTGIVVCPSALATNVRFQQIWQNVKRSKPDDIAGSLFKDDPSLSHSLEHLLCWICNAVPSDRRGMDAAVSCTIRGHRGEVKVGDIEIRLQQIADISDPLLIKTQDSRFTLTPWGRCYLTLFLLPVNATRLKVFLSGNPPPDENKILEESIAVAKSEAQSNRLCKIGSDAFRNWMDESEKLDACLPQDVGVGDFLTFKDLVVRVLQACVSVSNFLRNPDLSSRCAFIRDRVDYGVRDELLPLMYLNLPVMHRHRARLLFDRGIRTVKHLADADSGSFSEPWVSPLQVAAKRLLTELDALSKLSAPEPEVAAFCLRNNIAFEYWPSFYWTNHASI